MAKSKLHLDEKYSTDFKLEKILIKLLMLEKTTHNGEPHLVAWPKSKEDCTTYE